MGCIKLASVGNLNIDVLHYMCSELLWKQHLIFYEIPKRMYLHPTVGTAHRH